MSKKEKIDMMVEGGAAKADASLSQKLGPLKINIPDVLKKVNEKTSAFKGMKIPVKLFVNTQTKDVEIQVGTPPVSELLKHELKLEKGSGTPNKEKLANIAIEQLIKIAKMKQDAMLERTLKDAVKTIAGSCNSLGILVEGTDSHAFTMDVNGGKYDSLLQQEITTVSADKMHHLQAQLTQVQEHLRKEAEKAKAEAEAVAAAATPQAAPGAPAEEAKPGEKKEAAPVAGAKPEAGKPEAKTAAKPEAKAPEKKK
ncbi:50S ribosomal protein L11 [Candidatus Woesearchaeota archaeon]|nr:50S ribosomal protein L11 [Candidatus Woesearchaeota archaeon]